jgi:hypothetical protein
MIRGSERCVGRRREAESDHSVRDIRGLMVVWIIRVIMVIRSIKIIGYKGH